MLSRLTFLAIAGFWLTMNVMLWRSEFGQHGGDIPIPLRLVWSKILSAPDPSSLSVYSRGERTGYCEISTSVQQEMAKLDADKPPPEGLIAHAGYQLHINGNLSFGDFTNRLKFDGRILFDEDRSWREFHLRLTLHETTAEIFCQSTNQACSITISNEQASITRMITFEDLRNPQALIRQFDGDADLPWLGFLDLPTFAAGDSAAMNVTAHRTRIKLGREPVSVYRVETSLLGQPVIIDVSTIGEIMRVQMPNGLVAMIDPT